ncbi:DUF1376 domain-containing protein [Cupriavidus pauculus]|uniref:DUF1376 domain-containing protein n=2 Tax=Pseudomonadota TaxID=1224 RepID=A0A3G8H363_9BURK|nr:DUF1376 domain-containing protein [Cupriavidus pauculus]AZG14951.1 DUF1376 domain-containing protein [Cupriavidus pauculus]
MSDRPAPYPADTRAKGWRFELDLEQIDQSDTWALTPAEIRPWLLMLWAVSWRQTPCGSLPDDDELIAVRLGMDADLFAKHRAKLMRGWWKAEDGRLYHDTLTRRVVEMLALRDKEKNRKAEWRRRQEEARKAAGTHGTTHDVTDLSHGTDAGKTVDSHGTDDTRTRTSTSTYISSIPDGIEGGEPPVKTAEQMTKDELWAAGKSLLQQSGMPKEQCGSFVGRLVKDYDPQIVVDAVRAAVVERPADPVAYLKAACQRMKGERKPPNRQEALEANNRAVAERAAAEILGATQ